MHPPRIGLALVTCVALSACSPVATPTASPLPSMPVPTCTPEFGGEPFPCTESALEAQQKLDARYAEAERVLRRSNELEAEQFSRTDGELAAELAALYDPEGPYLEHMLAFAEVAATFTLEGEFAVESVVRSPLLEGDAPGTLALMMCVDGSRATLTPPGGKPEPGISGGTRVVFTETSGPRIWGVYETEEAPC